MGKFEVKRVGVCMDNFTCTMTSFKVVLHRYHGSVFGVRVKTVKQIGGRRFLTAISYLHVSAYLMVWMTLRLLCMPAQVIKQMTITQIMDI